MNSTDSHDSLWHSGQIQHLEGRYRDGEIHSIFLKWICTFRKGWKDGKHQELGCYSPLQGTWCAFLLKCINFPPGSQCQSGEFMLFSDYKKSSLPFKAQGFSGSKLREYDKSVQLYKCVYSLRRRSIAFSRFSVGSWPKKDYKPLVRTEENSGVYQEIAVTKIGEQTLGVFSSTDIYWAYAIQ